MSASQEKKTRAELRQQGVEKRQTEKQKALEKTKKENRMIAIVSAVLVLLAVFLVGFNSNLLYRNFTAVKVGNESFTAAEFSFFYKTAYNNFVTQYGDSVSYLGLDTSKSLSAQSSAFGEGTWEDYFKEQALSQMSNMTMLYTRAKEAGFTLNAEQQEELNAVIEGFETNYVLYGYSDLNTFLSSNYGKGLNIKKVSELLEMSYVASFYSQAMRESFQYTTDELEEKYSSDKDNYDSFDYLSYYISGAADEEAGIDAETAMAGAEEKANAIIAEDNYSEALFDPKAAEGTLAEDVFKEKGLELTETEATENYSQGKSISSAYGDWLKDASRKYGDMTVIADTSGTGYYVLFFLGRDDNSYETVAVRHILVNVTPAEDGTFTEEAKQEALTEAERILQEWKDGEQTEESFAALAEQYSEDVDANGMINSEGGLYEKFPKRSMVPEFNDWSFDPARQSGDTGIVFNEGSYTGYHIMYFVGKSEPYREYLTDTDLRTAAYSEWETTQMESFPASLGWTQFLVK
ncbi:MAG: peptidylprolyl isomerase [Oscillospiraceae bacterium]|jgi:hypothetical protein|nr:peptidylprolyl isomerase [Oscillospiraceae bacterium]